MIAQVARRLGAHVALVVVIVAVAIGATARASQFLTEPNLVEILRDSSTYFIIAGPTALLIIAGGLDFSIGAVFSVGAVVACGLMAQGVIWPVAVLLGLAAGAGCGVVSGAVVVLFQVPPVIATLATFFIATGLVDVFVKNLIAPLPSGFLRIGQGEFAGVPYLVWYAIAVGVLLWVMLEHTPYGYSVRAVGGNRAAALAAGIRVRRVEVTLYALSGTGAALAGILYSARTSAGQPDAGGSAVTLQVLTSVLVAGVSLSGGTGSVTGVALGTLLFGELQNALGIAHFDPVWSDVVIGAVLIVAVSYDGYRRRRRFVEPAPA